MDRLKYTYATATNTPSAKSFLLKALTGNLQCEYERVQGVPVASGKQLDLHHVDSDTKTGHISGMLQYTCVATYRTFCDGVEAIKEELPKCIALTRNDHRVYHSHLRQPLPSRARYIVPLDVDVDWLHECVLAMSSGDVVPKWVKLTSGERVPFDRPADRSGDLVFDAAQRVEDHTDDPKWERHGRATQYMIRMLTGSDCTCSWCDESRFPAIDFHHKNATSKRHNISDLTNHILHVPADTFPNKIRQIKHELIRCVPLCTCCHSSIEWQGVSDEETQTLTLIPHDDEEIRQGILSIMEG